MTKQPYETLPGGSIDYAHYANKAHEIRSRSFLDALKTIFTGWSKITAAVTPRFNRQKRSRVKQPHSMFHASGTVAAVAPKS